jgi:hypothetical protein
MTGVLEKKLSIRLSGKEPSGWYYLDGKPVLRVHITNIHGSAALSPGAANELKNDLLLDEVGLSKLYRCPMKGRDFENYIRGMGLV